MGVYIKGMEMPKSCSVCPMLEGDRMDGLCHAASKWLDDDEHWTWYVYPEGDMDNSKPCNCPLVEIPPHGRLIDADALEALFWDGQCYFTENIKYKIKNIETILPAEEGET